MNGTLFLLQVFFGALLRALLPSVFGEVKNTFHDGSEDALPQPELAGRLRGKVRSRWNTNIPVILLGLTLAVGAAGCGVRTVYVPEGEPVRLRAPVKGVPVWVMGSDGKPISTHADLAEGWYVLSDPKDEATPNPTFTPATTPALHPKRATP